MQASNDITIGQVIDEATLLVERFNETRVNDFTEFHKQVGEVLRSFGQDHGLTYRAWDLLPESTNLFGAVARLDSTFTDDKRSGIHRRGRLHRAWFTLRKDIPRDTPMSKLLTTLHLRSIDAAIELANERITAAKQELVDADATLYKLVAQKRELEEANRN